MPKFTTTVQKNQDGSEVQEPGFAPLATGGGGGSPSGPAGGDLGGTYPNPTVISAQDGFGVNGTMFATGDINAEGNMSCTDIDPTTISGPEGFSVDNAGNVSANAITALGDLIVGVNTMSASTGNTEITGTLDVEFQGTFHNGIEVDAGNIEVDSGNVIAQELHAITAFTGTGIFTTFTIVDGIIIAAS